MSKVLLLLPLKPKLEVDPKSFFHDCYFRTIKLKELY